jgi:DNA-binding MarR family transcriptional regulator
MSERRPPAFRDLLAYQVSSTADSIRRSAAMRMRREHDLSLAQVRTLALIDHLQPVRLRDVAADAGADKAQISRVVSSLVTRGYVGRRALVGDARSAHLELTEDGRSKFSALYRTLQERDRVLRGALQPGESEQLVSLLERVRATADRLTKDEEGIAMPGADEAAAA